EWQAVLAGPRMARRNNMHDTDHRDRDRRILRWPSGAGQTAGPEHTGGRSTTGLGSSLVLRAARPHSGQDRRLRHDRIPNPDRATPAACSYLESQRRARCLPTPLGNCGRVSLGDHDWWALVGRTAVALVA